MGLLFAKPSVNGSIVASIDTPTTEQPKKKKASAKWQPLEWRVEYERIVAMSVLGKKGTEIAALTGYTPQHIYNILGTPQAIEIEQALIERLRNKTTTDIGDVLGKIEELTVKRLHQALDDNEIFARSPATWVGKGLEVMKGRGEHLRNAPTQQVNNYNQLQMPESVWNKFMAGMEKSNQAALVSGDSNMATPTGKEIIVTE